MSKSRQAPIPADIEALIVDGIWGRFRRQGKRVLLTALGVDSSGSIHVLDWLVAKSESALSWIRLFDPKDLLWRKVTRTVTGKYPINRRRW